MDLEIVYFVEIFKWLHRNVENFGIGLMGNTTRWASAIALVLVTLWISFQGYLILSGQIRESMTALVIKMAKVAIIVTVASSMSLFGKDLHDWVTVDLRNGINELVTGHNEDPNKSIDQNLAYTQLAMAAIGAVDVPTTDVANSNAKDRTELIAMLGMAGPPMTAGALLLMYEVAIALFIGFGPIFIFCLLFEQTKALFHKWLMFGIGTLFSLAVLNFMVSLIMKMMVKVALALWAGEVISNLTGSTTPGYTVQAMQQGGVGLLMTVLLISTPPMAASFFNATIGQFYTYSGVNGGGANHPGPQGQPPGAYGGGYALSARPTEASAVSPDPSARAGGLKIAAHKDEVARPYSNQQG